MTLIIEYPYISVFMGSGSFNDDTINMIKAMIESKNITSMALYTMHFISFIAILFLVILGHYLLILMLGYAGFKPTIPEDRAGIISRTWFNRPLCDNITTTSWYLNVATD